MAEGQDARTLEMGVIRQELFQSLKRLGGLYTERGRALAELAPRILATGTRLPAVDDVAKAVRQAVEHNDQLIAIVTRRVNGHVEELTMLEDSLRRDVFKPEV